MRRYKAVVIDFKKTTKKIIVFAIITVVVGGAIFSFARLFNKNPVAGYAGIKPKKNISYYISEIGKRAQNLFFGFTLFDTDSILSSDYPTYAVALESGLLVSAYGDDIEKPNYRPHEDMEEYESEAPSVLPENAAPIKTINAAQKISNSAKVAVGNETSYSVDIAGMLASKPDIDIHKDGPVILICHTHATEAYAPDGAEIYDVKASDRCNDIEKNVVAVGKHMAEIFEKKGIKTVHDTILHDVPSFNGSYAHSLNTVSEYINKYPTIQIVFDIHRDSIVYDDNTKIKTSTKINGEKTAQLMFVVGTDEKGLYNPDWRDNMRTAVQFQNAIATQYPELMRHINLRKERFNGHTTHASMIIEVGTSGNSLEEAKRGIGYAAECVANYLLSL